MKISKRFLGAVTSAVCTLTACVGAMSFGVSASEVTVGDLTCETYSDHVEVTGCSSSATTVVIPSEVQSLPVTVIASSAFYDCDSLSQVTIPDSITSIGSSAFYGCSSLQSATIPSSVKSVGSNAFTNTAIISAQDGPVYYVSNWAVYSANATAVTIKSGTTGIADSTFYNCGLETVSIPSTVSTIGNNAFASNSQIRTLTIPSGVKTVGSSAFKDCSSLLTVTIGDTVTSIGSRAFYNCESLSNIKIPNSVTSVGSDAFAYTSDYNKQTGPEIYIDKWVVNCLDSTENLAVKIKNGTKGIADYAFANKEFVISASIPSGVVTVGSNAFNNCTALSQLTLPDTLTTINDYAFAYTRIPSVVVPASVTSIGFAAFNGCSNMSDITISNPKCAIYDSSITIDSGAKMHVAEASTAYDYAIKYGRSFDYVTQQVGKVGDVTGDGVVNLYDIIAICKHIMGMQTLTIEQQAVADYTGDGKIDLYDAIAMAKFLMS